MKVTIDITCDNAAFDPDPTQELGRILRATGDLVQRRAIPEPGDSRPIRDINDNTVGNLTVSE